MALNHRVPAPIPAASSPTSPASPSRSAGAFFGLRFQLVDVFDMDHPRMARAKGAGEARLVVIDAAGQIDTAQPGARKVCAVETRGTFAGKDRARPSSAQIRPRQRCPRYQ